MATVPPIKVPIEAVESARSLASLHDRIEHDLTLHTPKDDLIAERLDTIRGESRDYAHFLISFVGKPCRELSLALTAVEEACQYAIAAVVRNQDAQ